MNFKIAQISDLHCGEIRFSEKNLRFFINKINQEKPNLVVVAGDLTANGFLDEFQEAKKYLNKIKCKNILIVAGNHDARNVGYEHFESLIGPRFEEKRLNHQGSEIAVMSVDSNRPDDDEGEVGRDKYKYLDAFFEKSSGLKILVLHHHLIAIPKTGRERSTVRDAGDLLAKIKELGIDLVLSGHKHVPHVWSLNGVNLVASGTAGTTRTRGSVLPSINILDINEEEIVTRVINSDHSEECLSCKLK